MFRKIIPEEIYRLQAPQKRRKVTKIYDIQEYSHSQKAIYVQNFELIFIETWPL